MNRNPQFLAVSIAALAVSATFATAWAQKPAGTTSAAASSATPTASARATTATSASPSASASARATTAASSAPTTSASSAPTASASVAPATSGPLTGSADELFRKGNELAKVDKWAEAEPLYRAAWEQKKSYDIAGNLGLAEFQQRKWRDAAEHLSFAINSFPASGKSANRELLESIFNQVKAEVGAVKVAVSVPGADVMVDGKKVGVSPLPDTLFVDPGPRKIEASLPGYEPESKSITAIKGESQSITLELTLKQAAIAPDARPGFRPTPVMLIAGGAVAAVGLGAGIAFTVVANGKASDADAYTSTLGGGTSTCTAPTGAAVDTCASLKSSRESQGTFSNLAVASFVVGGVFALGTAGLAAWSFLSPAPPQGDRTPATTAKATARVVPVVDATTRGVSIVGRW